MAEPKLRFPEFTGPWEQRKCSDILIERNEQAPKNEEYPLMAFIGGQGVAEKGERYDRGALVKDEDGKLYKHTEYNDFIYSSNNLTTGSIGLNKYGKACISPVYSIFYPTGIADSDFIGRYMIRPEFINKMIRFRQGVLYGQWRIHESDFLSIEVQVPSIEEQQKIGQLLDGIDNLIALHQRKLDDTKKLKKALLQKMFPKDGESEPEIRFPEFTGPWEQRKFSELVTIERGGSPRPIDSYITEAEDGLNWVKIGDAPEMGNYITKTAQKIRPEGLKKTREVHPGDLILSNSMSFGRPYIMAINGCIHDGWLLIRDEKKCFDLKFLCALLGADSMLNQYKAMAAGSTVNNLNKELVGGTTVLFPSLGEQEVIGEFLTKLDDTITLHQRKLDNLKKLKKSLLQQMFV